MLRTVAFDSVPRESNWPLTFWSDGTFIAGIAGQVPGVVEVRREQRHVVGFQVFVSDIHSVVDDDHVDILSHVAFAPGGNQI